MTMSPEETEAAARQDYVRADDRLTAHIAACPICHGKRGSRKPASCRRGDQMRVVASELREEWGAAVAAARAVS